LLIAVLLSSFAALPLRADDTGDGKLGIELNTADTQDTSCTLTFLVDNGLPHDLDKLVLEAVIFTRDGQVERLTLFDFGELPAGRSRVRQFVLHDAPCASLGRVLFNSASTCEGAGLSIDSCMKNIAPSSRIGIEVLG
tara:strand:- start:89076 stop:89489 length:414 start_codon:yes stop_codon:yes gene_type:complete